MSIILGLKAVPRVAAAMTAVLSNGKTNYVAETKNLSHTGLCLRSKETFPVGTQLHIVFGQPPELPRLSTQGIVRWSEGGKALGVEFTFISPHDQRVLLRYVNSQSPDEQD